MIAVVVLRNIRKIGRKKLRNAYLVVVAFIHRVYQIFKIGFSRIGTTSSRKFETFVFADNRKETLFGAENSFRRIKRFARSNDVTWRIDSSFEINIV